MKAITETALLIYVFVPPLVMRTGYRNVSREKIAGRVFCAVAD
jgi:hypothetical protein